MKLFSSPAGVPDSPRFHCARMILLLLMVAILTMAPKARAEDGDDTDIDTDAVSESVSAPSDSSMANQVLEIPQQCDQDAVAVLCDRSANAAIGADEDESVASEPDTGSVYDYANQNIIGEASSSGTTNLPAGILVPEYPALSPPPVVVSSHVEGPGSYQQWASGPGTYQQFAPAPGFVAPMPLGYRSYGLGGSFGPGPFHSFGGGRFGRR
jgi:hypothetical protein